MRDSVHVRIHAGVSKLLSIKGLTNTPYHPICNGLVERENGTLRGSVKTTQNSGTTDKSCSICV